MDEKVVSRALSELQRWDKGRVSEVNSSLSVQLLSLSGLMLMLWRASELRAGAWTPCNPSGIRHSSEQIANADAAWGQMKGSWVQTSLRKKKPTLWPEVFSFTYCWGQWCRSGFHWNHQANVSYLLQREKVKNKDVFLFFFKQNKTKWIDNDVIITK